MEYKEGVYLMKSVAIQYDGKELKNLLLVMNGQNRVETKTIRSSTDDKWF